MWLMATILDSTALEQTEAHNDVAMKKENNS